MARAYAACFVIAAAVAVPGVIGVLVTDGHSHGLSFAAGTSLTARSAVTPRLRPVVAAVKRAFVARGVELAEAPTGPGEAHLVQVGLSGDCRIDIVVEDLRAGQLSYGNSCGTGELRAGQIEIFYSPPAVGPTIVQAVAGLPR